MNIRNMTDEELAKELQRHFDIPVQSLELARFIRRCVQDSMPSEEEIIKVIMRWDSIIADKGLAEDMAYAIRNLMEVL